MTSVCWTHVCLQYILAQGWSNLQDKKTNEKNKLTGVLNGEKDWVPLGSCLSRPLHLPPV